MLNSYDNVTKKILKNEDGKQKKNSLLWYHTKKKKKKKTEIFVQSIREHKNDSCQQFNNTAEISGMNEVNEN